MAVRFTRNSAWVNGEDVRTALRIRPSEWNQWLKSNLLPYHYRHFNEGDVVIWREAAIPHLILKMLRDHKPLKTISKTLDIPPSELNQMLKAAAERTLQRINIQQGQVKPRGLR